MIQPISGADSNLHEAVSGLNASSVAREVFDEWEEVKRDIDQSMTREQRTRAIERLEQLQQRVAQIRDSLGNINSLDRSLSKVESEIEDLRRQLGIPA
ncbi:hypothetical protein COT42_03070 [Candidatus Saganbacteria bacterium CG08_land_8_20_14_0_20_45_16]|uniref:Uncharacterized protein n=1 Tax=Candidatus Saganbacteria bacterium CG08_land_8_20_14_0_20_45_16 TaxID=2014293 RepID=A0A2H0Y1K9_UNCSA|nr:MAG: hypothetical protein COT42_03070 [Candidatus Saganbacteria bacterium CG08_land_8_20_14_0_20_45_16]